MGKHKFPSGATPREVYLKYVKENWDELSMADNPLAILEAVETILDKQFMKNQIAYSLKNKTITKTKNK